MSTENTSRNTYDHGRWEGRRRFLRFLLRYVGFTLLVKLDRVEGLENIPDQGPAILLINHIAFVDPIVALHIIPRNIIPLAKIEVYDYPVIGVLPRLWGVIPVRREEVDRRAIQQALQVLRAGEIILVAPEGTRGPQLQRGKEGMAYLASRSGAPIIPVAIDGTEGFPSPRFSRRWQEPGVVIKFGKPFYYQTDLRNAGREYLRQMADDAMYVLAGMLPSERRGVYQDLSLAELTTIQGSMESQLDKQST
ncbi:MAG TPA: lysophospholipid acyltransferase family protein [Anaerolineales bacterium]|nr:lysophospholipid acyltransferase family protein [Anaerolineales bacterium]